jgi:RNAse (barnase) inhibitor barstar
MPSRLIRNAEDLDALFTLFGNMKLPLTVDWVQGADRTAQQNALQWRWAWSVSWIP